MPGVHRSTCIGAEFSFLKSKKWKFYKGTSCRDRNATNHTHIPIKLSKGRKLQRGYRNVICAPGFSGAVFLGVLAHLYGKTLCGYDA